MAEWKLQAIEQTIESVDAKLTLVIIDDSESKKTTDHMLRILYGDLWTKYNKISWKLNPPELRRGKPVAEHELFADVQHHYCKPIPADGIGNEFPEDAIKRAEKNCDVLFRTGFGIIQGSILNATEYGVLSYHSGDIRKYRGKPPGFWEYMNNEPVCGITLQRLTEKLDGGEIASFKEIDIDRLSTWKNVRYQLNLEAIEMLSTTIREIQNGEFTPESVDSLGDLYTTPDNLTTAKFLLKNAYGYCRKHIA
jgi:hypothetical protein